MRMLAPWRALPRIGRRRFVQGLAGGTLLLGAGALFGRAQSASPTVLSGSQFDLSIDELAVNYTGAARIATAVNAQVPAPLLRWREGDVVTLRVTNRLPVRSSIHWHGIILPANMDGVPGLSFAGIAPGETYVYRFAVNQHGTYWYHSHSRFQEQTGLHGPIVIEPRGGERHHCERDYTVMLSDWSDVDPEHIYATLKRQSDYFNYQQLTAADLAADAERQGAAVAMADWARWARMRMDRTDLLDVSGATYTYLMNGATPSGNWTGLFARGERVRLRFINSSSMSYFDVRIPGLAMTVVAADGQDVEPVSIDEFRLGAAEVCDVIVAPVADRAYTIFAQAMDRSGYARGTLAPQAGLTAEVPALDPRPLLTMADMGMGATAMANMPDMPDMPDMPGMPQLRLDDPGVGLRGNGRRVLTYGDLHTIGGAIDAREPQREIELHLTGHMQRYTWSFNGRKFSESQPLALRYGERLRIVLVNDTMMTHPIHLHGMWSELEDAQGEFLVRKHTVTVQPGQRLCYGVSADALGRWAYHCHLLYHMEAGMFREVVVAAQGSAAQP
ncbi:MAG TPA: copper resistance system multicopper oxidase [Steroidobacteraceae bacterium]|jgi:CopA family copper-resistance protein